LKNVIEFKNINERQISFRNNFSLCSTKDPIREANQWYENQKWDFRTDAIVVLGIGAGFHLQVLQEKAPSKIIAIDFDQELKNNAETFLESSIELVIVNPNVDFKAHNRIQNLAISDSQFLAFRPSWQGSENEFSTLHSLLLGKDEASKAWQESFFDPNEVKMLSEIIRSLS
jgi:hypothetical protein